MAAGGKARRNVRYFYERIALKFKKRIDADHKRSVSSYFGYHTIMVNEASGQLIRKL